MNRLEVKRKVKTVEQVKSKSYSRVDFIIILFAISWAILLIDFLYRAVTN